MPANSRDDQHHFVGRTGGSVMPRELRGRPVARPTPKRCVGNVHKLRSRPVPAGFSAAPRRSAHGVKGRPHLVTVLLDELG